MANNNARIQSGEYQTLLIIPLWLISEPRGMKMAEPEKVKDYRPSWFERHGDQVSVKMETRNTDIAAIHGAENAATGYSTFRLIHPNACIMSSEHPKAKFD
ncbi:hypothetical protein H112_02633 [Trichophyton rubrum D6]|uniref:Uncharacterized protein n=2 Tax=Trichophyton TaxID=5550 RepID=A0A022W9D9_TRIRU|nr:hypothetical protein H103_02644 [Trichophyton rubrum CBS 288.86]EZF65245.1 hypothetical protein H104_02622 [Trichophyton rubrum CBS 289.86]EZF75944.1 hypothetical protein H105_02650 [Trichophyton soudanense CBS 452.61]EZF86566.1 hypothetical protein H110_02639 [Trichophyton rubrum MR1448]EZG08323.1 hypothetical protein H106_02500 [Trichophyton rubrum CBS 735.88]EZG18874.1 hypothetical protein H107_02718 [Trichophyton rubrum CBS 202.88]KDB35780.1 hypothetical protein H112_02633 [Trichophyto